MFDDTQERIFRGEATQLRPGPVGRSVVDIDDLEPCERRHGARDFADQRRDVSRLVTHGHDDRNTRRGAGLWCIGIGHRSVRLCPPAFYGPISVRATLLIRPGDGPGRAFTSPSRVTTKPRRRSANQSRTHHAPSAPTAAPAITSLTKCALTAIRLAAMSSAKPHRNGRARGNSAPTATRVANAVVVCPDGRLAKSGGQWNGS